MEDTRKILFEDRRNGRRTEKLASEVPEDIRAVLVKGERIPVARIATFEMGARLVIESYDADGRVLLRTVGA